MGRGHGATRGSRGGGGGYAAGVGRFSEKDIQVVNLKDKWISHNGKVSVFTENAYGYSVNGKILSQGDKIPNYGAKNFAEAMKGEIVGMKGLSGGDTTSSKGFKDQVVLV